MAYTETYTPITVANSRAFNDGADFNQPELMGGPEISMTASNGRSLSSLLDGFNQPPPAAPEPGSFVRGIELEAARWGDQFGQTVQQMQQSAANYWGTPVAAQAATRAPAAAAPQQEVTGLDRLGGLADGLADTLGGGSAPKAQGVEMKSLASSFGQLSQGEPSAFERRYQQPGTTNKNKGNDYV